MDSTNTDKDRFLHLKEMNGVSFLFFRIQMRKICFITRTPFLTLQSKNILLSAQHLYLIFDFYAL